MPRYERLPAFLGKKYLEKDEEVLAGLAKAGEYRPNIVEITNNVRNKADTPAGQDVIPVKISIPAERFEYPQFETLEEAAADCGGVDKLLAVFNDVTRDAATRDGKAAVRMATNGTEEEMIEAGLRKCKTYTWREDTSVSAKEKINRFDELQSLFKEGKLTMEELAKRFAEISN